MGALVIALVLVAVIAALGCYAVYQLILQHRRLLLRIEALEHRLEASGSVAAPARSDPIGLPRGSVLLDFELPDLSGGRMTLSQWRGRRLLLIFFDPNCGFCRQMLPDLAALPADPTDDAPVPLILTTGDAALNRALMAEYGVRCRVLLQEHQEVASLYQVRGTPMGYLVDEQGMTASGLAVGAQAVLNLAAATSFIAVAKEDATAAANGPRYTALPREGSLARGRLNRDGLSAGATAPAFRLPRVGGGELSLEDYRGWRVLLVFSDPACGPCMALAPALEQLHRRAWRLQVLMISRGSLEANEAKIAQHELTFPVVLQRYWEISRKYGMFATPIGYLVDEHGIIAADVAVGAEAILALVSSAESRTESRGHSLPLATNTAGESVP
ncbi:MAG TPA: redoxin domain-containing protein [Chloroflexota bacterium]|jgi:peroxiredoxin|nr:redoxin domain-containing protein [Chloroflexota bacterium]